MVIVVMSLSIGTGQPVQATIISCFGSVAAIAKPAPVPEFPEEDHAPDFCGVTAGREVHMRCAATVAAGRVEAIIHRLGLCSLLLKEVGD